MQDKSMEEKEEEEEEEESGRVETASVGGEEAV
jgi:hypothetical protein